ncbi:MAG: aldo/keto reductase [Kiritimatiellaeota bacterium]|nr:aldo/keto reductase [Kiritimatiellota bacterium]
MVRLGVWRVENKESAAVQYRPLGETGLEVPPIVFGTSCLGNLYQPLSDDTKSAIIREWFANVDGPVVADSAGKYGAGLALEVIGRGLRTLNIPSERIIISNKLGWLRVPLQGPEPTFEPGVWAGLRFDAEQCVGYDGILRCWEQGCELLGETYAPKLVSVHDPDEVLAAASSPDDRRKRLENVVGAYRALAELKMAGKVAGVGIGAKDWRVVREVDDHVKLDWVMFANSMTIYRHPPELLEFMRSLAARKVGIVNSAVFHAGFLVGGKYFDYKMIEPDTPEHQALFDWREQFFAVCRNYGVQPAAACVQYALSAPGVVSVALNTSRPERVRENVGLVQHSIPQAFWQAISDRFGS